MVPSSLACVNHPGRYAQTWRPTRLCRRCERAVAREAAARAQRMGARPRRAVVRRVQAVGAWTLPYRVIDGVLYEVVWDGVVHPPAHCER